jgi:2,4-dienoyl-CoA reductase-like NADH-dependent reductase (Old Yellow Enzyme family)
VATWPQTLAPLRIGGAIIRNRLGLGPINSSLFDDDGSISDLHLEFYDRMARERLGLLYIGGVAVCAAGRSNRGSLVLDSRVRSNGIARVAEVCHQAGVALVVQLMHAGRQTRSAEIGHAISAPSAIPCPVVGELPRALSRDEIQMICRRFGEAAALAEEAGADLIEIHGAHGYLVGAFLSPYSNLRRDDYRAIAGASHGFLPNCSMKLRGERVCRSVYA